MLEIENMSCFNYVNIGIIVRIVGTIIVFYLIVKYCDYDKREKQTLHEKQEYGKGNWKYIALAITIFLLDEIDGRWPLGIMVKPKCPKTFWYQITDKINDSLTYLAAWYYFNLDNLFLFFALFRIVGVVFFALTRNATYLISMFDFNKEYLVYLFLFGSNMNYLWLFIILKIGFEYYHHTIVNKRYY
jgi:hypothetical protein